MKNKSERHPYVSYEKWKTPIGDNVSYRLWCGGVLQACFQVFFFFYELSKEGKETHVLAIPRDYPYRVMEEEFAWVGIDRYLRGKDTKVSPKRKIKKQKPCSTWKFWNTDMIQELNAGEALTGYGQIKYKDVIHYAVHTGGDVVEFIAPWYRWELHKDIKVDKLIGQYVRKRYREKFY